MNQTEIVKGVTVQRGELIEFINSLPISQEQRNELIFKIAFEISLSFVKGQSSQEQPH